MKNLDLGLKTIMWDQADMIQFDLELISLWLYLTATFIGTSIVAFLLRNKF